MGPILKDIAETVARCCELASVAYVATGAGEAVLRTLWRWRDYQDLKLKKDIWRRFAAAILLALEFALAADIARTAIAPTWADIGQLAAIAAIRTGLNLFLERDIEAARGDAIGASPPPA
jgi:uncharacterized membrane protein